MDETTALERLNEVRQQERTPDARDRPAPEMIRRPVDRLTIRLLAAGKDGLDLALDLLLIGEIPVVGQLPGIGYSLLLTLYRIRTGWFREQKRRAVLFTVVLIIDNLPIANNLPLTFLSTFLK